MLPVEFAIVELAPPISNLAPGLLVPIPTFPLLIIRIASVPPLLPTVNLIEEVVPTPVVDLSSKVEVAVEPPTTRGVVTELVKSP